MARLSHRGIVKFLTTTQPAARTRAEIQPPSIIRPPSSQLAEPPTSWRTQWIVPEFSEIMATRTANNALNVRCISRSVSQTCEFHDQPSARKTAIIAVCASDWSRCLYTWLIIVRSA